MEEMIFGLMVGGLAIVVLFIGLPWLIFHYVTKWKSQATLTAEDENMLDDLHEMARRLDDRLATVERIMTAENPNWKALSHEPTGAAELGDLSSVRRLQK